MNKKKLVIVGSLALMVIGWAVGLLVVANSVFGFTFLANFQAFIAGLGTWAWVVFSILFVIVVGGLFFVEGLGSSFIYLSLLLFPLWKAFAIAMVCILLASMVSYLLGDLIGEKPFKWVIGAENYEKANKVVGSPTFIALALLLPYFPDSLVCFFAGTSKMKWYNFAIITAIARSIGVAGICFLGSGVFSITTWEPVFTAVGTIPALMIMFATLISFLTLIVAVFLGGKWLEKKFEQRKKEKENKVWNTK